MKGKWKLLLILPVAAVICFIFFNSTLSNASSGAISKQVARFFSPILNPFQVIRNGHYQRMIRKIAHFVEFFALGGCLGWIAGKLKCKGRWAITAVLAVLIACADEIIQCFSADRSNSFFDVVIDVAGALCGMAAIVLIKKYRTNRGK